MFHMERRSRNTLIIIIAITVIIIIIIIIILLYYYSVLHICIQGTLDLVFCKLFFEHDSTIHGS